MKSIKTIVAIVMMVMTSATFALSSKEILENDIAELRAEGVIPSTVGIFILDKTSGSQGYGTTVSSERVEIATRLGLLDKQSRLFIILHEVAHAINDDNKKYSAKIMRVAPREFSPSVRRNLIKESKSLIELSHAQELAADKFAGDYLKKKGMNPKEAAIVTLGDFEETNTHPAKSYRVSVL